MWKQSKYIICPICNEICLINLNITKLDLVIAKMVTKIIYDKFFGFQKIYESKIIFDKCEENKNGK